MTDSEDRRDLLAKLFEHSLSEEPKLRAAAYRALGNFTMDDDVLSCLLGGLSDEDGAVRRTAGSALIANGYLTEMAKAT